MSGVPLELDWNQLLPEKKEYAPPLEVEVIPTLSPSSSSPSGSEASLTVLSLTDRQIDERLQGQLKLIKSGLSKSLPDNGKKLLVSIRLLEEELERRKFARIKKSIEISDTTTNSRTADAIGTSLHVTSESCSPSFSSLFNKKMDEMAGSRATNKVSSSNPCEMHERMNSCYKSSQSARLSLKNAHFQPASELASRKRRSVSSDYNSISTSSFYSQGIGKRYSKRLKDSEGRGDTFSWKKIQTVDILDEEDVQSKGLSKFAVDDRKEVKIYYPSRDDPQSVELSYSDLKCLEPEQYISSPIMNFYIRYLQKPVSPVNGARSEFYFFNTYFYGKLEESLSLSKCDRPLSFSKLRRWWKGVNIFEKAYVFLPIHKILHWSLVIISIPPEEDRLRAIILHLDSLGLHNSKEILQVIHCYLMEEWQFVNPTSKKISIGKKEIKVPQQKNEYDCGLFVLYFMERFMEGAPQRLESKDLNMFGSKWFQPEEASGLRKRLKDLLLEEFESTRLKCGREEIDESTSSDSETEEERSFES